MLKLSTLHTYLSQVLDLPDLHTAILLTPAGQLISYASDPSHSKEDVRLVVGLGAGSFLEVEEQGFATLEVKGKPHLGHIYVLAVNESENEPPLMLLVLNYRNNYDESVVQLKAKALAAHLAKSLSKFRPLSSSSTSIAFPRLHRRSRRSMRRGWPSLAIRKNFQYILCRKHSVLAHNFKTVPRAATVIDTAAAAANLLHSTRPDPYILLASELDRLKGNLLNLLGSAHPSLHQLAQHYFSHPSKQIRSLVVLLLSRATNGLGNEWEQKKWAAECERVSGHQQVLDWPLTRRGVLNDVNPNMPEDSASFQSLFSLQAPRTPPEFPPLPRPRKTNITRALVDPPFILPTQIRLAQLMEMIHIANCMHDQVTNTAIDGTGNKLAILGGDFLLGRASTALSRLGDEEVVELVATVIANIVEGTVWKASNVGTRAVSALTCPAHGWSRYLNGMYLASASLLAKAGRAAVILGGSTEGEIWKEVAYMYGLHIGFANQLMKDINSLEKDTASLGEGLTGPLLYAWEDEPNLGPIIQRQFSGDGDVEQVSHIVFASSGVERTRTLAFSYAEKAREVLHFLPDSDTKDALEELTIRVVERT
ncbi:hypothetical protein GYMLUDRAFT_253872 [Collybiopsis luxurians FD-317 M1]|nr:hypothetical protein GYMLUDRAFT_253872 [Collybiopsis luxurians FD-317 M1]